MEDNIIHIILVICTFGLIICDAGGTNKDHLYYYDGSGEVKIQCNGNDVINVTGIQLTNHPTDCPRDMCNLTDSDRNHIKMCNGNSSCEISKDELSHCINDRSFYGVDYACQDTGHYMYGSTKYYDRSFRSKRVHGSIKQCLTFYYYINDKGDSIVVKLQYTNGTTFIDVELSTSDLWDRTKLSTNGAADYTIEVTTKGFYGEFAVDDLIIFNKDCTELTGIVQHKQNCNSVGKSVELTECSQHYLSNIQVNFEPLKNVCKDLTDVNINSICETSGFTVLCNVRNVTRERPSCFSLTDLMIEFTCSEIPIMNLSNQRNNDKDSTGVIVGVVIGLLLVVGIILGVLYIIYRRKENLQKAQNKSSASASRHSNNQLYHQTNRTKNLKTSNNGIATNRASSNPSYGQGYIITSSNEFTNAASKQTTDEEDTEYMNITTQNRNLLHHSVDGEYKVLDPSETGFNRSNPDEYELASPVNEIQDDNYAESVAGVYDISGNSRHKVKDTIYDRSVDDNYDTSNRGRQEDLGDYTYNHVFGKQTEDEYDIAGS